MSIVSYAQNFEDVMLWRALHHVEQGRYLDIGAQDPVIDSVSLAFYEAGWRGTHVEPTPAYAEQLRKSRPDETVIEAAVTDAAGPIRFYELGGLSSGRPDVADHHARNGHHIREMLVPTVRLGDLLEANGADIHWLKIDVEGMEREVLRSWGDCEIRPWLLVIEATFPNTQEPTHHLWIDEVLRRGYEEVFFDGLSRYFLHEAHHDLSGAFASPASVFDAFQVTSWHFATSRLVQTHDDERSRSEQRGAELEAVAAALAGRLKEREADQNQLTEQLQLQRTALARQEEGVREFRKATDALMAEKEREVAAARSIIADLKQLSKIQLKKLDAEQRANEATRSLLRRQSLAHYNSILRATVASDALSAEIRDLKEQLYLFSARARADKLSASAQLDETNSKLGSVLAWSNDLERSLKVPHDRWVEFSTTRIGKLVQRLRHLPRLAFLEVPEEISEQLRDFRQRGLPNHNELLRATPMTNITHVDQLLAMNGSAMIDAAYRSILKRSPDREGRAHFNERLADGASKEEILYAFTSSAEARTMPVSLEGLDELGARVAEPFSWMQIKDHLHQIDRKINRIDYRLGEQLEAVMRRLGSLEAGFGEMRVGWQAADEAGTKSHAPPPRSVKSGLEFEGADTAEALLDNLQKAISKTSEAHAF